MHPFTPGPGQESVWDYPRPPRIAVSARRLRIIFEGILIAESTSCYRVLETSHPPCWYVPPGDVAQGCLTPNSRKSFCEFKGTAVYWDVRAGGKEASAAAWSYPHPTSPFSPLRDYVAFYPSRMQRCLLDEEPVKSQPGDFYGGWITADVVGPFKGGPGTKGW